MRVHDLPVLRLLLFAPLAVVAEPTGAEETPELIRQGRTVAERHCVRCHVIDDDNRFSGISSTPSFPLLVRALADWEARFLSFHTRLPHPSIVRFKDEPVDKSRGQPTVPVEIDFGDIAAIVAYVRTLADNDR
ncbi:c-type cytochrome [Oricola sp.]|uniref:c-type cytochrome n=1 Tax=Oricola sp. TaxID=1979950 RepID=UPI003BA870F4